MENKIIWGCIIGRERGEASGQYGLYIEKRPADFFFFFVGKEN